MKSGWHWDCNIFFGSALRKQTCMTGILFIAVNMLKTKTRSFCLYRTFNLFLVILLCLWLWKPKRQVFRLTKNFVFGSFTSFMTSKPKHKVLCLDKTFIPCSLAWFMALKTKTGSFYDLIRPLFLVFVYGFNFQQGKFL